LRNILEHLEEGEGVMEGAKKRAEVENSDEFSKFIRRNKEIGFIRCLK
jgi:hypothetical protein